MVPLAVRDAACEVDGTNLLGASFHSPDALSRSSNGVGSLRVIGPIIRNGTTPWVKIAFAGLTFEDLVIHPSSLGIFDE